MKKNILLIVLALMVAIFSGGCGNKADSVDFPLKPTTDIYVVDNADMFSDSAKESIINMGKELDTRHEAQVVVVSVYTTGNMSIEEYSTKLFREWDIGDKEKNNGVLVLIARDDKKFRIEVGYGLEGCLTDNYCGEKLRILKNYFKDSNYSDGMEIVYRDIVQQIYREYGDMEMYQDIQEQKELGDLSRIVVCFVLFYSLIAIAFIWFNWGRVGNYG